MRLLAAAFTLTDSLTNVPHDQASRESPLGPVNSSKGLGLPGGNGHKLPSEHADIIVYYSISDVQHVVPCLAWLGRQCFLRQQCMHEDKLAQVGMRCDGWTCVLLLGDKSCIAGPSCTIMMFEPDDDE